MERSNQSQGHCDCVVHETHWVEILFYMHIGGGASLKTSDPQFSWVSNNAAAIRACVDPCPMWKLMHLSRHIWGCLPQQVGIGRCSWIAIAVWGNGCLYCLLSEIVKSMCHVWLPLRRKRHPHKDRKTSLFLNCRLLSSPMNAMSTSSRQLGNENPRPATTCSKQKQS